MNNFKNSLEKYILPVCEADRMIRHIVHEGQQIPLEKATMAKHVRCPRCDGNDGFFIPHLDTWSCLKDECIKLNSKKPNVFTNKDLHQTKAALDLCQQPPEIIKFLREYAKNPKGFLILAGMNGTGKTYAAKAVYEDFNCESGEKKFIKQVDLFLTWNDHIDCYNSTTYLLKNYCEYKLLVLDDLGTRKPSEAFMDFLYAMADKRYSENLGTIITTNLTADGMLEKFGDAFSSRVTSGKAFRFEGKDRRHKPNF